MERRLPVYTLARTPELPSLTCTTGPVWQALCPQLSSDSVRTGGSSGPCPSAGLLPGAPTAVGCSLHGTAPAAVRRLSYVFRRAVTLPQP